MRSEGKKRDSFEGWLDAKIDHEGLKQEVDELVDEILIQQNLTDLRVTRGLSQRELARRIDVSQPVIARIESRRIKNVTLKTLVRAAAALGARLKIELDVTPSGSGSSAARKKSRGTKSKVRASRAS
jgi:ribosome-binding protein aMBF1 (putative translation factor)